MSTNFHQALSTSGTKVFFAAGAGAYSLQISNIVPDFFVDNDVNKHDTLFKGIPVYSPIICLLSMLVNLPMFF